MGGINTKQKKGRKGPGLNNSEAASGGCCFGMFGGGKKKQPILPEVKEVQDEQLSLSPPYDKQTKSKIRNKP